MKFIILGIVLAVVAIVGLYGYSLTIKPEQREITTEVAIAPR